MKRKYIQKNIAGEKFGKLTALRFVERRKPDIRRNEYYWEFQCDCGNKCIVRKDRVIAKKKPIVSCGCERNKEKWTGYEEISGSHWGLIKKNALKRNIKFELSIQEAWEIFENQNKKCKLTGIELKFNNTRCTPWYQGTTASLDRIDSKKSYTKDNVQWIHKELNIMKLDFTMKEFITWCKLVVNYNKELK